MITVIDASTLSFLIREDARPPIDKATGEPVGHCQARLNHFLENVQKTKSRIVIPAPALTEVLVYAGSAMQEWLEKLTTSRYFRIAPFDTLAAVECAIMAGDRRRSRGALNSSEKHKAKFDEQIVAIAKIEQASLILSEDKDIRTLCGDDIECYGIAGLPLPPVDAQLPIIFGLELDVDESPAA